MNTKADDPKYVLFRSFFDGTTTERAWPGVGRPVFRQPLEDWSDNTYTLNAQLTTGNGRRTTDN